MVEKCSYTIVALTSEGKKTLICEDGKCLRKLVWDEIGVKAAAAQTLKIDKSDIYDCYVEGNCNKKELVK